MRTSQKSSRLILIVLLAAASSGCATGRRAVTAGPVNPGYLGHWSDPNAQPSGEDFDRQIRRDAVGPTGLPLERVSVIPTVPFALAFQAVAAMGDSRAAATSDDKLFMYSVLEMAYAGKRSCLSVAATRRPDKPYDGSQWVLYLEDADRHFYRLAAADVLEREDLANTPGVNYPAGSPGATDTGRGAFQGPGSFGGSYCTENRVDYSRPFNVFIAPSRDVAALTRLAWFPAGGQALATSSGEAAIAITADLAAHPDFKTSMRRVEPRAMETWSTAIRRSDYKKVLSTIDFKPEDATLSDRYSLGILAMIDAGHGPACSSDFIKGLFSKGALLSPNLVRRTAADQIDACAMLDLVRFLQIPGDREGAFERIHGGFVSTLHARIVAKDDRGVKHAKDLVGVESVLIKHLGEMCQAGGPEPQGPDGLACAMLRRAAGDVNEMRTAFKSGSKTQKSASVRKRLRQTLKLLEPIKV